jgi:DNA polymerase delta subunit 3
VLVDVSREILTSFGSEDALELGKHWGMIQNEHVRRRKTARPPPPPVVAAPLKAAPLKKETAPPKAEAATLSRESSQKVETKITEKAPARGKKGDLFSSFANAKAKAKLKKEDSAASSVKSVSVADELNHIYLLLTLGC